jgi:hypothetical protein
MCLYFYIFIFLFLFYYLIVQVLFPSKISPICDYVDKFGPEIIAYLEAEQTVRGKSGEIVREREVREQEVRERDSERAR